MTLKATAKVTTIGIDTGSIEPDAHRVSRYPEQPRRIDKNSFHLIGLDGRFGSKPEVQRGPRNVRCWG